MIETSGRACDSSTKTVVSRSRVARHVSCFAGGRRSSPSPLRDCAGSLCRLLFVDFVFVRVVVFGHDANDGPRVRRDVSAGCLSDVAGRHAAVGFEAAEDRARVAEQEVVEPNLLGLPRGALQRLKRPELEPRLGSGQLVLAHHLASHAFELVVERREELAGIVPLAGRGVQLEEPGVLERRHPTPYLAGDFFLDDERSVRARSSSAEENFGEERERRVVGVSKRGAVVADEELFRCGGLLDLDFAHVPLRRLGLAIFGRDDGGCERPVGVADQPKNVELVHVPDDDDERVVRRIVRFVEAFAVLRGEPEDVGHPADRGPMVRVLLEGDLVEKLARGPLYVVVDAEAAFVRDYFLLTRDLSVAEDEAAHSLALELHRQGQAIGREGLIIIGPVDPRRRVRLCAVLLQHSIELAGLERLRLVEHQVLEQVREPGLSRALVARADGVPGEVAHHRSGRVFEKEKREPVPEPVAKDRRGARPGTKEVGAIERPMRGLARRGLVQLSQRFDARIGGEGHPVGSTTLEGRARGRRLRARPTREARTWR